MVPRTTDPANPYLPVGIVNCNFVPIDESHKCWREAGYAVVAYLCTFTGDQGLYLDLDWIIKLAANRKYCQAKRICSLDGEEKVEKLGLICKPTVPFKFSDLEDVLADQPKYECHHTLNGYDNIWREKGALPGLTKRLMAYAFFYAPPRSS